MICLLTLYFVPSAGKQRRRQQRQKKSHHHHHHHHHPPATTNHHPKKKKKFFRSQHQEEAQQWYDTVTWYHCHQQFITLLFYSNNAFYGEQLTRRPCFATFQGYFERASLRVIRKTT